MKRLTAILLLMPLSYVCLAQQDTLRFSPTGGQKLALVIGNQAYATRPLTNPVNDAKAVAQTLFDIGFEKDHVFLVLNAGERDLRREVREFIERVKPGDLAFVYYSGHGVEVKGNNYLLPVDLPSDATENYVADEAVAAQRLLRDLEEHGAKVQVLILDACRDNPLRATSRSTASGLGRMETSGKGTLVAFSTQAGQTASDTPGARNSVFTKHLVSELRSPGIPIDEALRHVSRAVALETNQQQIPAIYASLLEDVVLVAGTPGSEPPIPSSEPVANSPGKTFDPSAEAWALISGSKNPDDYYDFAAAFPESRFSAVAKATAERLGTKVNAKDGARYLWIRRGKFMMGCSPDDNDCRDDEKPAREVTIEKGFWLAQTPVTVAEFRRYTAATGLSMPPDPVYLTQKLNPGWQQQRWPIVNVSWVEAKSYCEWAGMRLPTEAEFEYAARGGTTGARYGELDEIAWYLGNSGKAHWDGGLARDQFAKVEAENQMSPHPVGTKAPNAFKLYDMLGNVSEYTSDWDKEKSTVFVRGGCFHYVAQSIRASARSVVRLNTTSVAVGFRCAGN